MIMQSKMEGIQEHAGDMIEQMQTECQAMLEEKEGEEIKARFTRLAIDPCIYMYEDGRSLPKGR